MSNAVRSPQWRLVLLAACLALPAIVVTCTEEIEECPDGWVWADPDDPDNQDCVKKHASSSSSGVGAGGGGGTGGAIGTGGGGAEAGTGGTSTSTGGTSTSTGGTGTGGTVDPPPCGGTPDQSQNVADGWAFTNIRPLAQSFTPSASTLSEVAIYVHTSQQLDPFTVYVLADKGGNPDLNGVLGSAEVQNSAIDVEEWLCADIPDITVTPGAKYWILLNEAQSSICKNWHESNEGGDPYPKGTKKVTNDGGATWKSYPGEDFTFRTYP
jgi:hypothetical protein